MRLPAAVQPLADATQLLHLQALLRLPAPHACYQALLAVVVCVPDSALG